MSKTTNKFSPKVRVRAIRIVGEHRLSWRTGVSWNWKPLGFTGHFWMTLTTSSRRPTTILSGKKSHIEAGVVMEITSPQWHRKRRDYMMTDTYPQMLDPKVGKLL